MRFIHHFIGHLVYILFSYSSIRFFFFNPLSIREVLKHSSVETCVMVDIDEEVEVVVVAPVLDRRAATPSPVTRFVEGGRVSQTLDGGSKTPFDST